MTRGSVLRSVGRSVTSGVKGPRSPALSVKPSSCLLRISTSGTNPPCASASSPTFASASGSASAWSSCSLLVDGEDWERVGEEGEEEEPEEVAGYDPVFDPPPSREEAEYAVSALRQILGPELRPQDVDKKPQVGDDGYGESDKETASLDSIGGEFSSELSEGCQSDWREPAIQIYRSNSIKSKDHENILGAIQLFQKSTSLQGVVASLSADEAVWGAVMKNKTVQDLKQSLCKGIAESNVMASSAEHTDTKDTAGPFWWIVHNVKAKIRELIGQITKVANEIFHKQDNNGPKNENEEAFNVVVRSAFMMSIMVFVIIIMKRLQNA